VPLHTPARKKLRNYKRIIKTLYDVAHEKHLYPPVFEWERPYRSMAVEDLRKLSVERGLSSPLGASATTKKDLVINLAAADYQAFDNETK